MKISDWIREDSVVNVSPSVEGDTWYTTRVIAVSGNSFSITPPKTWDFAAPAGLGRKIRISVPSKEGLFLFTCSVVAEAKEPDLRIELEFPKEVEHLERRAYPRLPIQLETQYAEIRHGAGRLSFSPTNSLDISGGGMRLETNRICPPETLLRVKFQIPLGQMEEELILTGRIVRAVPGEGARKSQIGVEFIDISPRQQESLMQFVLDRTKEKGAQA